MKYENIPLLSPLGINDYSALEYLEYVKSMRKIPESKTRSKAVEGINISSGKKLILKIAKEKESVSLEEIELLVKEFGVSKEALIERLVKRKIKILDGEGNEQFKPEPKQRKPRKAKEGNAGNPAPRKRKSKSTNQLVEPGPSTDVQTEGEV
jgi:hypothetical protein